MKIQCKALKYMCQYLHLAPKKKGVENVTLVELVWREKKLMYPLAFWFSSLNMLTLPQITGDDWQIKTVWVKSLLLPSLFIYFFCQRCSAVPRRKLRFQTVQSEFPMRCNSMENIKCQSQFCTLRWERFLTLHWLAHVCAAAVLFFSTVRFSVHIFLCFLPLKIHQLARGSFYHFDFPLKFEKLIHVAYTAYVKVTSCKSICAVSLWENTQQVLQMRKKEIFVHFLPQCYH